MTASAALRPAGVRDATTAVTNIQTDSTNTGAAVTTLQTDINGKTGSSATKRQPPGGIDNRVAMHAYVGSENPGSGLGFSAAVFAQNGNTGNSLRCGLLADGVDLGVRAISNYGTAVKAESIGGEAAC